MAVADAFPNCRVLGMDIAPIQPRMVPANCEFMVGDVTDNDDMEYFNDGSTDLVHSRYLSSLNRLTDNL